MRLPPEAALKKSENHELTGFDSKRLKIAPADVDGYGVVVFAADFSDDELVFQRNMHRPDKTKKKMADEDDCVKSYPIHVKKSAREKVCAICDLMPEGSEGGQIYGKVDKIPRFIF